MERQPKASHQYLTKSYTNLAQEESVNLANPSTHFNGVKYICKFCVNMAGYFSCLAYNVGLLVLNIFLILTLLAIGSEAKGGKGNGGKKHPSDVVLVTEDQNGGAGLSFGGVAGAAWTVAVVIALGMAV